MADAVATRAGEGDAVFVQDYHFSLLGRMLAERRPDLCAVHFLHTPFADPGILAVLPDDVVTEILDGMSGYAACGFHAHKWEASFVGCYAAAGLRPPRTFVAPLGPDADVLAAEAAAPDCAAAAERLREEVGGRRTIVRSDRMEPSKNIVRGMLAFEELLHAHPEWRGDVVHVALAYPSRQGLAEYLAYGAEVTHTAERINHSLVGPAGSRSARDDWTPIVLHVEDDRARALAALTTSDVLLVNPVRDGLNLVAKEGPLLNAADGVLVLSHEAGAWEELSLSGGGAIGVNPFDVSGTAEALHTALSMPVAERKRRAAALRATVRARTSADWWADQLAAAAAASSGGAGAGGAGGGSQA
jgi:trehalose 6-phosphate synthase